MAVVYFGCSMRGGYNNVARVSLEQIPDIIESLWHIIPSKHQIHSDRRDSEDLLSNDFIHDRNYNWIKQADVWVFEISNPSLWVGAEISDMLQKRKHVLCLCKYGLDVSAYVLWKQWSDYVTWDLDIHTYETLDELKQIISNFLE